MISADLLAWYHSHARDLPWRTLPAKTGAKNGAKADVKSPTDPYRVWLSEVMLQQTTVAAVKPYFAKFTQRWPTVTDLAAAAEEDVMAAWAGLGYYSRARNLVKCAAQVAEAGGFPASEAELLKLPGLGPYTAAAIAAIAFGERAVVVDANVERVVSRLFAIEEELPKSRPAIRQHTDSITPDARAGDFAQAMMDLGATICTSRDPKCLLCPLTLYCDAQAKTDPATYPRKAAKKAKPVRTGTAYWIENDGQVWLETRQGTGMLGGMRALPDDGWNSRANGSETAPVEANWQLAGMVRHTFTHFTLEMNVMFARTSSAPDGHEGQWWDVAQIDQAGLPTLFKKAATLVIAQNVQN